MLVKIKTVQFVVIILLADFVLTSILNGTKEGGPNLLETRRQRERKRGRKDRSTSSSSGERKKGSDSSDGRGESLQMTSESESSLSSDGDERPKSSKERTGWRKWHRKCASCPEDMRLKWRDPRVKWICGAYQRARRSFKSLCMMHYRNCQDGTMFVKIYDHRCQEDNDTGFRNGQHFFYDYKVEIEGDSSKSGEDSSSSSEVVSFSD